MIKLTSSNIEIKTIDKLGRITIPAKWRKDLGNIVLLIKEKNSIKIVGLKDFKLTDLFDSIEFTGDLHDWEDVKKLKRRLLDEISRF